MLLVWLAQVHLELRQHLSSGFRLVGADIHRGEEFQLVINARVKEHMGAVCERLKHEARLPLFPRVDLPGPL